MHPIFVFGSNLAGRHGKGAAKHAHEQYNAKYGSGPTGNAYAIPTKDANLNVLPLEAIQPYVTAFIAYASAHPHLTFRITRVGCGLAGYTDAQMTAMFAAVPLNCILPVEWQMHQASLFD